MGGDERVITGEWSGGGIETERESEGRLLSRSAADDGEKNRDAQIRKGKGRGFLGIEREGGGTFYNSGVRRRLRPEGLTIGVREGGGPPFLN